MRFLLSARKEWQKSPIQQPLFCNLYSTSHLCTVKEIGLQTVWAQQAFYPQNLTTATGKSLTIVHRGEWNHQDGPDFLHAEIQINNLILHGAIEIHNNANEWYAHKHHTDPRFNQTILHVVLNNNKACFLENGQPLECLELKHRIRTPELLNQTSPFSLPCEPLLSLGHPNTKSTQLNIALTKRIHEKTEAVLRSHKKHNGDWWFTALEMMLIAWMGKANQPASQTLIHNLHKSFLMRNRNPLTMTAYWFGQSGWLPTTPHIDQEHPDDFLADLTDRYQYLQLKHNFTPSNLPWNSRQLRPSAFPQIRMAQWAQWLHNGQGGLDELFSPPFTQLNQWIHFFTATPPIYWQTHYQLNKPSTKHSATNGQLHALQVITNGLIPFLFAFSLEAHKPHLYQIAMDLLEQMPPEDHRTTRLLSGLAFENTSAKTSQSIIAQHQHYCTQKQCLHCAIGRELLSISFLDHTA